MSTLANAHHPRAPVKARSRSKTATPIQRSCYGVDTSARGRVSHCEPAVRGQGSFRSFRKRYANRRQLGAGAPSEHLRILSHHYRGPKMGSRQFPPVSAAAWHRRLGPYFLRIRGFRPLRPFRRSFGDSVGLLALLAFRVRWHDATSLRQERGVVGFEPSTGLTMAVILLRAARKSSHGLK